MTRIQQQQLTQIKQTIDEKADFIEIDPKARFLVNHNLKTILKDFGMREYNRTVIDLGLDGLNYKIL